MSREKMVITRRNAMQLGMGFLAPFVLSSCGTSGGYRQKKLAPESKINKKAYWARREEWKGEDWVYGIVEIGDRILMVYHKDTIGWGFPGGIVQPFVYGEKNEKNDDLIKAATFYVHDQALVPVMANESIVLAYGYMIDERQNKIKMTHWLNVFVLGDNLPTPQPSLVDVQEARWVATDDPELGEILKMRLEEIKEVGEGKTGTIKLAFR